MNYVEPSGDDNLCVMCGCLQYISALVIVSVYVCLRWFVLCVLIYHKCSPNP